MVKCGVHLREKPTAKSKINNFATQFRICDLLVRDFVDLEKRRMERERSKEDCRNRPYHVTLFRCLDLGLDLRAHATGPSP